MRDRRSQRPIPPDNGLYFSVDVNGRETWWRVPVPVYVGPLIKAHADAIIGQTDELEMALDVTMVLGAAIGRAWADPDKALEAQPSRDVLAYGESVVEELHEAGWSIADIGEAGRGVMARLSDAARIASKEVEERAGFSRAQRAAAS